MYINTYISDNIRQSVFFPSIALGILRNMKQKLNIYVLNVIETSKLFFILFTESATLTTTFITSTTSPSVTWNRANYCKSMKQFLCKENPLSSEVWKRREGSASLHKKFVHSQFFDGEFPTSIVLEMSHPLGQSTICWSNVETIFSLGGD